MLYSSITKLNYSVRIECVEAQIEQYAIMQSAICKTKLTCRCGLHIVASGS